VTGDSSGGVAGTYGQAGAAVSSAAQVVAGIFGGHGAGTTAGRSTNQVLYMTMRLAQQAAARARRQWEFEHQSAFYEPVHPGGLVPVDIPDPLPVKLSTRLTDAQQAVIRASQTPSSVDDRWAQKRLHKAEGGVTRYTRTHPEAVTTRLVNRY
jgi:hypothetical protein